MPDKIPVAGQLEGILIRIRNKADAAESRKELISMLEDFLRTEDTVTKKSNLENKRNKNTRISLRFECF